MEASGRYGIRYQRAERQWLSMMTMMDGAGGSGGDDDCDDDDDDDDPKNWLNLRFAFLLN